jgi:hypothetical protein
MKLVFFRQIFEKYPNFNFHENPSSESRVVPCGRTDRQADVTKLRVAFRNFANAPKNTLCALKHLNESPDFTSVLFIAKSRTVLGSMALVRIVRWKTRGYC